MTVSRDASGKWHYTPTPGLGGGGISRSPAGVGTKIGQSLPKSSKIKLPANHTPPVVSPELNDWLSRTAQDRIDLMSGNVHDEAKAKALGLLDKEGGLTERAKALGVDPGEVGKDKSPGAVERTFDVLSRPIYAVGNMFAQQHGRTEDTKLAENPGDSTDFTDWIPGYGLAHKIVGHGPELTSKTLEAGKRGLTGEEKTTFSKMYAEDLPQDAQGGEKAAAASLGLISDIVLDPTTYIGAGLAKDAGKLIVGGGKSAEVISAASKAEKGLEAAGKASKVVRAGEEAAKAPKLAEWVTKGTPPTVAEIKPFQEAGESLAETSVRMQNALKAAKTGEKPIVSGSKAIEWADKLTGGTSKVGTAKATASNIKGVGKTKTPKTITINPHEKKALVKIHSTEPILQGGKTGAKAIRDVAAAAEKEYKIGVKAKNGTLAAEDFVEAQKVGKRAVETEKAAAQARVEDAALKLQALRKTDPALKVQLKVMGRPIVESAKAGKSLELANKAFKATKAGDLLHRGFVGSAESGKVLHSIKRQFANVTAGEYEDSLKQLKKVFDGEAVQTASGVVKPLGVRERVLSDLGEGVTRFAKTTRKDRADITKALEAGRKEDLLEKFHPTYDYLRSQLDDIAKREVDAGVLKPGELQSNYVYHVYQNRRKIPLFGQGSLPEKAKKFGSLAEAEAAGAKPVMDAADMLAHRIAKSHQVVGRNNMLRYIGDSFGVAEHGKTRAGKSFREMVDNKVLVPGEKVHSALKGYYLPADVAESTKKMIAQFAREPTTHEFGKMFDKVQAKFKFAMTAPNPGFHLRNLLSDTYMNFLDGVTDPRRYDQALRVLRAGEKDTGKVLLRVGGEDLTARDVMRLYEAQGLKAGYFHAETGVVATGASRVGNKVTHGIRTGSEMREDFTRLAHFIDSLEKEGKNAKSLEEAATGAAARVKKYNFDYQDLTHFEQTVLKRAIPFYTFMRKNIPVQLESLLVHPGKVSGVNKAQQSLETAILGRPDPDESMPGVTGVIPDWLREMNPTSIGRETADGQDASFIAPDLPYQQASQLLGGFTKSPQQGVTQMGREILGGVSPLAKIPAEAAMGRDITTGAPNSRNAALIAANNVPVVRNAISDMGKDEDKKNPEFTINIGGRPVDVGERWINYFTGAGVRKVGPARITSELMRRDQEAKDNIKAKQKENRKGMADASKTNSKDVRISRKKK